MRLPERHTPSPSLSLALSPIPRPLCQFPGQHDEPAGTYGSHAASIELFLHLHGSSFVYAPRFPQEAQSRKPMQFVPSTTSN